MLPALYLLLTLACAGVLLALLRWPGQARAGAVWGLAALLPLLAALAGALAGQARAARTLANYTPRPVTLTFVNRTGRQTLTLEAQAAACVERAVRLRTPSALLVPQGRVFLVEDTRVTGNLPPQAVVEALGIRGDLTCPQLRTLTEEERADL
jgi:hypothetical protein